MIYTKITIPWMNKGKNSSHEGALYASLDVIGGGNPSLAQKLHDQKTNMPYSAHFQNGLLTIGLLEPEVTLAVCSSPLAYKANRIIKLTRKELIETAGERNTAKLIFETPTSFSHRSFGSCVMPTPELVFGSLARRAKIFGLDDFPELPINDVVPIWANIRTKKTSLQKYVVYGCEGSVVYKFPAGSEKYFNTLCLFAEFSGIGQRTTQGFGKIIFDSSGDLLAQPLNNAGLTNPESEV